jgi:hypothetical protein
MYLDACREVRWISFVGTIPSMGARRVDRFQVEREAGRRGMGIVYRR